MDKKLSSPLSTLQWVDRDRVKPNDYNPNKVLEKNLQLLLFVSINLLNVDSLSSLG